VKLALAAIATAGAIRVRGVSSATNQMKADAPISSQLSSEVTKLEYLIVFSVVAMMTSFVWIIARCLRHA
jgi:hypothetical protein